MSFEKSGKAINVLQLIIALMFSKAFCSLLCQTNFALAEHIAVPVRDFDVATCCGSS
jgi:hypothetical protein